MRVDVHENFQRMQRGNFTRELVCAKFTFPNFQHSYFLFKEIYVQHLPHMNANWDREFLSKS